MDPHATARVFGWSGRWMFTIAFLIAQAGCSPVVMTGDSSAQSGTRESYRTWQILEANTGRPVPFSELIGHLSAQDVVYLGEEHHNQFHIEAALKVLLALLENGREPVIAIEMLGWDGQAGLDRYLSQADMTREQFLQDSRWQQSWGGAYEDYEPLISFARAHRLPVQALNPPRALVRRVAKQGLALVRTDPEIEQWGMRQEELVEDPTYRQRIMTQLLQCHGGGTERDYQPMYEASLFRDEGMAKTIVYALRTFQVGTVARAGPIVSYTGGGHIQYKLPVPNRVARRQPTGVKQVTIYLVSLDPSRHDEIEEWVRDGIADYVWLTPISSQGPPRRCR